MFGVCCDNRLIQMVIGECDEAISCTECFGKVVKWLDEEYVEEIVEPIFQRKTIGGKVVSDTTDI